MKNKNQWILFLIIFGVSLFSYIHLILLPGMDRKAAEYEKAQLSPRTHDISSVMAYKNRYMGNASNLINLFHRLPLKDHPVKFHMDSKKRSVVLNYDASVEVLGGQPVMEAMLYDATAAFALIDNLEEITFLFQDRSYTLTRAAAVCYYGKKELSTLLDPSIWSKTVQEKLSDPKILADWAETMIPSLSDPTKGKVS